MTDLDLAKTASALVQPVNKLIDAVSEAIGVVYEPARIRRRARAEGEALIVRATSEVQRKEIELRAIERLSVQELRRQENIDAIVDQSIKLLPATVSPDPVDGDWMVQHFRGIVALAEVASSGLSELEEHDIHYGSLLELEYLGLIHFKENTHLRVSEPTDVRFGTHKYRFAPVEGRESTVPVIVLTNAGSELSHLCEATPAYEYHQRILEVLRNSGSVRVEELPSAN